MISLDYFLNKFLVDFSKKHLYKFLKEIKDYLNKPLEEFMKQLMLSF